MPDREAIRDEIAQAMIYVKVDWADEDDMELSGMLGWPSLQKIADGVLPIVDRLMADAQRDAANETIRAIMLTTNHGDFPKWINEWATKVATMFPGGSDD